jgi:hypothetical protein
MDNFNNPTRIIFGKETVGQIGGVIKERGSKRVLPVAGGGSVIDTGKSVATGVFLQDLWAAFERQVEVTKALPIFVVLTMSGTGSEMDPLAAGFTVKIQIPLNPPFSKGDLNWLHSRSYLGRSQAAACSCIGETPVPPFECTSVLNPCSQPCSWLRRLQALILIWE